MDDPSDKIKAILSDPDSLKMLAQIASSFLGNSSAPAQSAPQKEPDPIPSAQEPTVQTMIPQAIGEAQETAAFPGIGLGNASSKHDVNDRINVLKSIRPYLSDHRKSRVDSLIKALGTAKVIETYKDVNILGLLGQTFK